MWRSTILDKYPVITLNKFFNCRKQLFFRMFTIILIIYFNTIFIHKKRVLRSNFSANAMTRAYLLLRHPSFISGVFTLLNWRKFLLFIILLIDERVIPFYSAILRGARCVCGVSTCVNSSIKLAFASVVTDLGRPDPSFLFMVPLSLKRFKSLFMDV